MGWFDRIVSGVLPVRASSDVTPEGASGWSGDVEEIWRTAANIHVSAQAVAKLALVATCCNKIARSVAALPLKIYERTDEGRAERPNHPLADLLGRQANAEQTALEFRIAMTWELVFRRAAYARIVPGERGFADQLVPLRNAFARRVNGELWIDADNPAGPGRVMLHREEVFRLVLPPFQDDGVNPQPVWQQGRETFAKALALQQYASEFFANGGGSGETISMKDGWFASDEEADKFLAWFRKRTRGANRHAPRLVPFSATVTQGGVKNNEAQFLETWKATALEIIGLFDIPPHKVGNLEKATFSNIEQQALEFVQDTLLVYLEAWEQAITRDLILATDRYYAEHTLDALVRGDLQGRYAAYAVARQWGWMSVNDILRRENMNPIGARGDIYLTPLNMGEAGVSVQPGNDDAMNALSAALMNADPDGLAAALKSLKPKEADDDAD